VAWSLVTGWGPLPALGWDGLAIGTTCGYFTGGYILLAILLRGRAGLRLERRGFVPDRDLIRRLLWVGVPGGGDVVAIVSCHLWYVSIINSLGTLATAAHGVGVRIESLAYLPGYAFQVAATTMVGQFLGAKDYHRASRSVLVTFLVGGGVMVAAGVVLYAAPAAMTRLFVRPEQTEVIALTASLLPIVALSMPALAVVSILGGALRGAGDTRWPLVFTFVGLLIVRIPGTYWLAHTTLHVPFLDMAIQGRGLGVRGAWYAMVTDVVVRCVLIAYRFWHGGWKRVRV
jgi:putative MATE family efflux protein